jgi:hypothetical protein
MRSSLRILIAVTAALLVVPSFAGADDVGGGDDLSEVISRMSDLEQQLKATNDALAASTAKVDQQQKMLSKLGTSNQSGPMLALSNFLTETTFEGWVSTSYFWNTNDPDSGRGMGANGGTVGANPFHPNHNSFQVDQVWFSMSNEATPESRGGFEIDIVYGETGDRLATGFEGNALFDYLYNANISYLAPITDAGIKITAGRFETHTGTESAQDPYNYNITRGLLYTLQPVNFTGLKIGSKYDNGLDWMVGLTNNSGYQTLHTNPYALAPGAQNYDTDDKKALIWRVGFDASDEFSIAMNGLYGGNCATEGALGLDSLTNPTIGATGGCGITMDGTGRTNVNGSDKQLLLDFTINWDPSDKLSTWVNLDYMTSINNRRTSGNPYAIGIAAAGRYAVTDATGISLRGEYINSNDNYLGMASPVNLATIAPDILDATSFLSTDPFPGTIGTAVPGWYKEDQQLYSLTGTVDHALTEHLSVKAEVVYQRGNANHKDNGATSNSYFCNKSCQGNRLSKDQVLLGAQMTYEF